MRIHATSTGLDPARLVPGGDLVLELDEAHGLDAAMGAFGDDYLTLQARRELDVAGVAFLAAWRERCDDALTIDGVCLPFIREWPVYRAVVSTIRHAAALDAAMAELRPESVVLAEADPSLERIVTAVAARHSVPVVPPTRGKLDTAAPVPHRANPLIRRLRRLPIVVAGALGAPSVLRRGSVVVISYWPLLPLLDRMLSEDEWRPAVPLQHLPTGPRRSLQALGRGGWIGLPSLPSRRRAAREASAAIAAARADAPDFDVIGFPIADVLHDSMLDVLSAEAPVDLAEAKTIRRAFKGGRVAKVVGAADVDPYPRLIVSLAKEAGIPTFLLAHGAYLLPQPLVDLEVADEVALWSTAVAPPTIDRDRPIHVVGYPIPHDPPPTKRPHGSSRSPRVAILGQRGHPYTATIDARIDMRQWESSVGAVADALPRATVMLRPHPGQGLEPLQQLSRRFPSIDLRVRATEDIMEVVAECDLCIGGASAATLQAALVGTPVIVLNLTGLQWPWPIGGDTDVPVARSREEAAVALETWAAHGVTGRESLLAGLGAEGGDATDQLVRLLRARTSNAER